MRLVKTNYPKTQLYTNDVPNEFLSFYLTFKREKSSDTHERKKQDSVNQDILTDFFFRGKVTLKYKRS